MRLLEQTYKNKTQQIETRKSQCWPNHWFCYSDLMAGKNKTFYFRLNERHNNILHFISVKIDIPSMY